MANGKTMQAVVNLAGSIDPSLGKAIEQAQKKISGLNVKALAVGAAVGGIAVATGKAVVEADVYKRQLLMAVQQLTPAATFLRDRYFPTNDASDIFATDDVLVEFRDGSKKLAPFVAPCKGGVTVLRAGYNMERYTPPFVAPRRVLTLDELRKRCLLYTSRCV